MTNERLLNACKAYLKAHEELEAATRVDPADDGPEVDIIERERFNRIWERVSAQIEADEDARFEKLLKAYFRSEAWDEFQDHNQTYPATAAFRETTINKAGGGFIVVTERI